MLRLRPVREAVKLGELQGAVNMFDVAKDTAGTDGSELLIITNQPDTRPTVESETDGGVEGQSVSHPASSMMINVDGPTVAAQSGSCPFWSDQMSLAMVSVWMPVCSARTAAAVPPTGRGR